MPRFIDLSHPLEHGQPGFPGDPEVTVAVHDTIAGVGYNITRLSLSTHQGTHCDAPYHFFDDGKAIDQVPLDRFFGPATLVDLAPNSSLDPRTPITIEMLQPHEPKFRPKARVIYRTGWDRMYPRPEYFTDYPTLTLEAARWIARKHIYLLGMDTSTPSTEMAEAHWALLGRGVETVLIEGLTNLDKLPEKFTFVGLPLNIKGRDGSPIRAVGVVR